MNQTDFTFVIFRKWCAAPHEVIALFPELPGDNDPTRCLSYEHVGQHGSADPGITRSLTEPATEAEYADLKKELEAIGYKLIVGKRFIADHRKMRAELIRR